LTFFYVPHNPSSSAAYESVDVDSDEARRPAISLLYPGEPVPEDSPFLPSARGRAPLDSDRPSKGKGKDASADRAKKGGKKGDAAAASAELDAWRARVWAIRRPRFEAGVPWSQDAARFGPPVGPKPERGDTGGKKKGSKKR
jgi:hypothetical protein